MKIAGDEPDILMITEVIPKAQSLPIASALLDIHGYSLYTSFDPLSSNLGSSGLRGILIYVSNRLNVTEVSFGRTAFSEQLWVQLPLVGNDRLLLGCAYRSPSQNAQLSTRELCDIIRTACASNPSHLLVTGDFNLPHIDWDNHFSPAPSTDPSHEFLEMIKDCFLFQQVTEPRVY